MSLDDEIINRTLTLIEIIQPVLSKFDSQQASPHDQAIFATWRAQVLNFLQEVLSPKNNYIEAFKNGVRTDRVLREDIRSVGAFGAEESERANDIDSGITILAAVAQDIKAGDMRNIRTLITADVFTDFMQMSAHLYEKDYLASAAALSTAVLEDALRYVAKANDVAIDQKDTLDPLNNKCAKKGVYTKHWQKKITVWVGIRNLVDHGKFPEFEKVPKKEIKDMINGIQDFLREYHK
ncbi:MAG: hypothetical protein WCG09_07895 [Halobacteriota archaeon]